MCTICGKQATCYTWNFFSCSEHKLPVSEDIYICSKCGALIKNRMECYCGKILCEKCVPEQHHILRTVDGDYCEDCDMYIVGHQCYFIRIPRDHSFCRKSLTETEEGFIDLYNNIELDNNLVPLDTKNENDESINAQRYSLRNNKEYT